MDFASQEKSSDRKNTSYPFAWLQKAVASRERVGDPWPVGDAPPGERDIGEVGGERTRCRDITDSRRDRGEAGYEMLHRFHHHGPAEAEIDPELSECVGMEGLGANGVEDDVNAAIARHPRDVADPHLGAAEGLPGGGDAPADGHLEI